VVSFSSGKTKESIKRMDEKRKGPGTARGPEKGADLSVSRNLRRRELHHARKESGI
jgi:hypothetical protein